MTERLNTPIAYETALATEWISLNSLARMILFLFIIIVIIVILNRVHLNHRTDLHNLIRQPKDCLCPNQHTLFL